MHLLRSSVSNGRPFYYCAGKKLRLFLFFFFFFVSQTRTLRLHILLISKRFLLKFSGLMYFTKHYLKQFIKCRIPFPLKSYSPFKFFQGLLFPDKGSETMIAGNGNPTNLNNRDIVVVHICLCFQITFFIQEKVGGQKTGFKKVQKFRHVFLYIF